MDHSAQEFCDLLEKIQVTNIQVTRKKVKKDILPTYDRMRPEDFMDVKVTSITFRLEQMSWRKTFPKGLGRPLEVWIDLKNDPVAESIARGVRKVLKESGSKSWNHSMPKGCKRWMILMLISQNVRRLVASKINRSKKNKKLVVDATTELRRAQRVDAIQSLKKMLMKMHGLVGKADLNRAWEEVKNETTVVDVMSK